MFNKCGIILMNYKRIYDLIIENRVNNIPQGYTETHHIVPRSLGGKDDKENLVKLSAREHYICHLLLTKIYKKGTNEYFKMVHAYMMMCTTKTQDRDYKVNSRLYENYKIEYSNIMSVNQLGELNSQFGTQWIYNPIIKESKKVSKNSVLEHNWFIGRVTNWDNHYSQKYCPVCNKKGLPSKKAKYCSDECCGENKFINSYVYQNKEDFIKNYIETKSINESLIKMGKVCAGGYYTHALKIIKKDENLYKIYLTNKK